METTAGKNIFEPSSLIILLKSNSQSPIWKFAVSIKNYRLMQFVVFGYLSVSSPHNDSYCRRYCQIWFLCSSSCVTSIKTTFLLHETLLFTITYRAVDNVFLAISPVLFCFNMLRRRPRNEILTRNYPQVVLFPCSSFTPKRAKPFKEALCRMAGGS